MSLSGPFKGRGNTALYDKVLGAEYDRVRRVHDSIDAVDLVAQHISGVLGTGDIILDGDSLPADFLDSFVQFTTLESTVATLQTQVNDNHTAILAILDQVNTNISDAADVTDGIVTDLSDSVDQLQTDLTASVAASTAYANQVAADLQNTINISLNAANALITDLRTDHDALVLEVGDLLSEAEINTLITSEQTARIDGDTALVDTMALIGAVSGDGLSFIMDTDSLLVSPTESIATRLTTIAADIGTNDAAITTEETARISGDDAITLSVTLLDSRVGLNEAAILTEQTTRADADSAAATTVSLLTTRVDTAEADILTESAARVSADSALSTQLTSLTATVGANTASIGAETTARTTADTAIASDVTALTARVTTAEGDVTTNQADIITEQNVRATADTALSLQISLLTAGVEGGFDPKYVWYFDNSDDGFTASGGTLTTSPSHLVLDSTGASYIEKIISPVLTGGQYPIVRLRIKRTAGTGLEGSIHYRQDGGSFVDSGLDLTGVNPAIGEYETLECDLVGISGYMDNDVDGIRIYLGDAAADDFEIDWVAIGRNGPAASSASVVEEAAARAAEDLAISTDLSALTARVTTNEGDIVTNAADIITEQTARADGDTALSASITALTASTDTDIAANAAAITTETTARTNADTAIASDVTALDARVTTAEGDITTNAADIVTEQTARASGDTAEAAARAVLSAVVDNKARVFSQAAAPTADQINDLWFDTDDNNKAYRWNGSAWVATDDLRIAANEAAIVTEQTARADGDSAIAADVTALDARVTTNEGDILTNAASISTESTARADGDTAISTTVTALDARVGVTEGDIATNAAAITTEQTARADGDTANATSITNLTTTVGANTASITTVQSSISGIEARYGVTLDVDGYITGFSQNNDGVSGDFIIRADRFAIIDPADNSGPGTIPFEIDNGIVKIKNAVIDNLEVDRLGDGTLTADVGLDGDINVGSGRIIWDNGTYMKVAGVGFGTTNQFIEWYGPKIAINTCSEANATMYLKTNGDAYFGGALTAGTLKNAVQTTQISADASVSTGTFGSNGGNREVTLSYTSWRWVDISGSCDGSGSPSVTVKLYRNGTEIHSLVLAGSTSCDPGFGVEEPGAWSENMSGSVTITDTTGGLSCEYTATITARTLATAPSSTMSAITHNQTVSVVSIEE